MKSLLIIVFSLVGFNFLSCSEITKNKTSVNVEGIIKDSITLLNEIKSNSEENKTMFFDMEELQTDDFSKMTPMTKEMKKSVYNDEPESYIYTYLSSVTGYISLITYQKNYEGEHRVDYIDFVILDKNDFLLDKIRLAAVDNETFTYEVNSTLNMDTLKVFEKYSTEYYDDFDTLFTTKSIILLNGENRIDTLESNTTFKVRKY